METSGPSFDAFPPGHRERLIRAAASPSWRELLARTDALADLRASVRRPPDSPSQRAAASGYLIRRNGPHVTRLIREGVRDEERLVAALADWESALESDDPIPVAFVGLVVTLDCSFLPRCVYCNQIGLPRTMAVDDWKAVLDEVSEPAPPYVYLTGGEPLLLAAEVWGDDGIVAHAVARGCAVNINTNAALITPAVALRLAALGTARIHVSLDSPDQAVQDDLLGEAERTTSVLDGLMNVQIARDVLGVDHPKVHVNCVLTARNLDSFPDHLRFVRGMRRAGADDDDYAMHLIPVGGPENALLRPTAAEWKRFYTKTWERAEAVWDELQAAAGAADADREPLADAFPFLSPWHRAKHEMDLDEYCAAAARGSYWQGALGPRCHVAPTQAFVLPDGTQHWCGAHAIGRPRSLGKVGEPGNGTIRGNIRHNAGRLRDLPNETCSGCAGATCAINQSTERALRRQVREWLDESPAAATPRP